MNNFNKEQAQRSIKESPCEKRRRKTTKPVNSKRARIAANQFPRSSSPDASTSGIQRESSRPVTTIEEAPLTPVTSRPETTRDSSRSPTPHSRSRSSSPESSTTPQPPQLSREASHFNDLEDSLTNEKAEHHSSSSAMKKKSRIEYDIGENEQDSTFNKAIITNQTSMGAGEIFYASRPITNLSQTCNDWIDTQSDYEKMNYFLLEEIREALMQIPTSSERVWDWKDLHINKLSDGKRTKEINHNLQHQEIPAFDGLARRPKSHEALRDYCGKFVKITKKYAKCTYPGCVHPADQKFPSKEEVVLHLLRRYVCFVCSQCGKNFNEKHAITNHQNLTCFIGTDKVLSSGENDSDDDADTNEARGDAPMVATFKIFMESALQRAKAAGKLTNFADFTMFSKSYNLFEFAHLYQLVRMREGRLAFEGKKIKIMDKNNIYYLDYRKCFQIINLLQNKSVSLHQILESVDTDASGELFTCKFTDCECKSEFTATTASQIMSHIQQLNLCLACPKCHKGFKTFAYLQRHYKTSCFTNYLDREFTKKLSQYK